MIVNFVAGLSLQILTKIKLMKFGSGRSRRIFTMIKDCEFHRRTESANFNEKVSLRIFVQVRVSEF